MCKNCLSLVENAVPSWKALLFAVPSWKALLFTAFLLLLQSCSGLWNNVEVQHFNEERGNVPLSFPWSKSLPEWVGVWWMNHHTVLQVCSFPGQEQATWESVGIPVSTLPWSYFLGLELHAYAGALSSLGLVCSKPWVLSAGAVLGRLCPSVHLPSALFLGVWGSREHLPPFPESAASAPWMGRGNRLKDPKFSFFYRPFGDLIQAQKLLWCSLRERQQLNYHSLFTPQLTWNFLA